jgi:hypothetical protein
MGAYNYPGISTDSDERADAAQYGMIANYDCVVINGVTIPIKPGSLSGGKSLFVNHKKASGSDFARYVSQGLDSLPVKFTFNLFIDEYQDPPKDWRREYEKIESLLSPKSLDRRNAFPIYHPALAAKGIVQVISTTDPILNSAGVNRWTCEFTGLDVRAVGAGQGKKATKTVQAPLRTEGLVPPANNKENVVGPANKAKGKALTKWPSGT